MRSDKKLISAGKIIAKIDAYKKVGNIVEFGAYEQDNDETNGAEDIEWIVLAHEDNRSLLISKNILYFSSYGASYGKGSIYSSWESCYIRSWLTKEFLSNAFTVKEKKAIIEVETDKNVSDKIFVLNYSELDYLSQNYRKAKPSDFALAVWSRNHSPSGQEYWGGGWDRTKLDYTTNDTFPWWLRDSGSGRSGYEQTGFISGSGSLDSWFIRETFGVRPALWIDLNPDTFPSS